MSIDPFDEALLQRLRVHEPNAARSERVRALCRVRLALGQNPGRARRGLAPALLAGFSAAYLFAIAREVLQMYGLR